MECVTRVERSALSAAYRPDRRGASSAGPVLSIDLAVVASVSSRSAVVALATVHFA
ncbi:predicted protein [Streptomyces iranensis]|uniref:Uncharacterized protein n=1 Tax=Streptomyces iranensis TaxID=576784 RepID=A0A060ZMA1_9ACTN|nr:hypothetical protein [Streptomyces iranensis]CDR07220.1 predicted protein [Streptomyces iranensis]